jgi:hypothetical protein
MSLARLWMFLAVALPVLASLLVPLSTVDLAYHLRAGAEIVDARALPTVDTWTFTAAGLPWVDQQWGAQVVLHAVYALGGWIGLAVVRAALIGVVFGGLFAIGRRSGLDVRLAAVLTMVAFVVAVPALALRPQLLGMVCFVVVAWLVTIRRETPRALWLVPVVVAIWANLHGSFFLGPILVGLAWLQDVHDHDPGARRALVTVVASAVAACLTPFGPLVWGYAIGLSVNPEVTARITEWQPTTLRDVPGILFFGSALAVVALIARRGRVVSWPALLGLAGFFLIGLYAQRGLAWWALGAAPIVASQLLPHIQARERTEPALMRRLNVVVAAVLVVVGVVAFPGWRPIDPGTLAPTGLLSAAPSGITAALRAQAQPGDRVFNEQAWGSWLEFALPALPVAIDSRIELFPATTWDDYEAVLNGTDGWQAILDRWDPRFVALADDQVATRDRLLAAGWRSVTADDDGVVLERAP